MVIVPSIPMGDFALCVGKYPVVNSQYERFVRSGYWPVSEPSGQNFNGRAWEGPFYPWQDDEFNDPRQPVVCVSFLEAKKYCQWVDQEFMPVRSGSSVRLPTMREWETAAAGSPQMFRRRRNWLKSVDVIHHKASRPAQIDPMGDRTNKLGFSDMFGNVWEWCSDVHERSTPRQAVLFVAMPTEEVVELRGGSYLDDLRYIEPSADSRILQDGLNTRHSDLGFRIAAILPIDKLPGNASDQIARAKNVRIFAQEPSRTRAVISSWRNWSGGSQELASSFRSRVAGWTGSAVSGIT